MGPIIRRLRWRITMWQRFGIVWCRACRHRWSRHHAYGYRCNHPPPRDRYPADAEKVIAEAMAERPGWIKVSPTAIASAAMTALYDAGFQVMGHRKDAG